MVIERDQFFVYFSETQTRIATRLLSDCAPMAAYLEQRGLPVTKPLHIILDDALDLPQVQTFMIPHREIRIPVKAPGVLEDGFQEKDPWSFFLFMGLSAQGIYSERSGIPGMAHRLFGEIISPTIILPYWAIDGIGFLLYEEYHQRTVQAPLEKSIFESGPIPDLSLVSHHPEIWPGRYSFRIYGRPFVRWLEQRHGWDSIRTFIDLQGKGIVPIEIDSKARAAFGASWNQLWQSFQEQHTPVTHALLGTSIVGYWDDPFVYWNDMGIEPGLRENASRGRYGYVDAAGWLRLSQYDREGKSRLRAQRGDSVRTAPRPHVWDPGPGQVAITRQGHRPVLIVNTPIYRPNRFGASNDHALGERLITAPPDVIQLSGPMMDSRGRIAVAGNTGGQWDIWLHENDTWHRITNAPSVELDPWIEADRLLFVSNITGRFQIHTSEMRQLTDAATAAMLPRGDTYLQLGEIGWVPSQLTEQKQIPSTASLSAFPAVSSAAAGAAYNDAPGPLIALRLNQSQTENQIQTDEAQEDATSVVIKPYSPLKSLRTNYISPDIFFDPTDQQIGFVTHARDVAKTHAWNAGLRYSVDYNILSWRVGAERYDWNARATFYPFGYTTSRGTGVNEHRHDVRLGWSPLPRDALQIGLNWRYFAPQDGPRDKDNEWWGTLTHRNVFGNLFTHLTFDLFDGGSRSLYGDILYWFGERITTLTRLRMGKTWGDLKPGHNNFRIGGNSAEGFFTQRPTRLFPLRGFDSNVLEAGQAASATLEIIYPLLELQAGYKTLPLFLRNMRLGTFIDAGFASDRLNSDEVLIGAGFQLITGMEIAWGFMADFSMGVAWPLKQPGDLDHRGPQFLVQIGRPL
jgi:hypothetical protein